MSLELPGAVDVREVGLRDGLQLEQPIPLAEKLVLVEALVATGVRRIEATAFVSPRAVPAMADCEQVAAELHRWPGVLFSALVASPNGARRALDAGFTELEYVISAVDGHSLANVGRTSDEALELTAAITDLTHRAGGHLEAIIAVAWDCPFDGPTRAERTIQVATRATDLGADRLVLGDTIGSTTPRRAVELIHAVRDAAGLDVGVHFHDTRGTGQANVLAAVQAGVTQIDSSVGGLGGCPFAPGASGNIATEELVYMLEESGVDTGIDLNAMMAAASLVESAVGHPLASSLHRAGGRPKPLGRQGLQRP